MNKNIGDPDGSLTGAQMQVMEKIWKGAEEGASVAEVWYSISAEKEVARTTVLTVIQRLERRGWVKRIGSGRKLRYIATCTREEAINRLSSEFIDDFFDGSASELVMSLLGSHNIKPDEISRLKKMLDNGIKE